MKFETKNLILILTTSICLNCFAQADLATRVDKIINHPSLKKVQFSIHILKADTGQTVYKHNAHKALSPASNMKIVTAAAAVKFLGPDYQYKTKIGICNNALTIISSGDPLLGDKITDAKYTRTNYWILDDIVAKLKENGITAINNIIVDTTIFDDQRVHPNWPKEQLNRDYACEVSGLNFNGNCIDITAQKTNGRIAIIVDPATSYVRITNKVVPISKGKGAVGSYRLQQPNNIIAFGKCKNKQGPFAVAIERPAAFFGFLLAEHLAKTGITVEGQLIEKTLEANCDFKLLAEYSTPITDCLARCNKDSFGLAAEALLKTIAADNSPNQKNGSWQGGQKLISQYLLDIGIEPNEFYIDDGSGLSNENRLSANAITTVFLSVYKNAAWPAYKKSLAVGGIDGTIRKYFKEEKYKGRILGKTGYIAGAKSFSGVCSTPNGDYIFSVLTNKANGKTRTAINNIAKAIFD